MRRRAVMAQVGAALAAVPVWAQGMPVVGYLGATSPPPSPEFARGLGEAGFVDGRNVTVEFRWAEGHYERLAGLAADLVRRNVAVIVTEDLPATRAAQAATTVIPIVFWTGGDPVEQGLVTGVARPGGNLTGIGMFNNALGPKRLELLRAAVPAATLFGLLANPANPATALQVADAAAAAGALGVELVVLPARSVEEIAAVFAGFGGRSKVAMMIASDPFFFNKVDQIVGLAAVHGVPTIYTNRDYAVAGGLMSYASSNAGLGVVQGTYAGRILNGARPGDLPVVRPTKFDMVLNLATAKSLGLVVPPALLARADEIIE